MIRDQFKQALRSGFQRWWGPLLSDIQRTISISVLGSAIAFALLYFRFGWSTDLRNEFVFAIFFAIGAIGAQVVYLLWLLLSEPFRIMGEQVATIERFRTLANRSDLLSAVHDQLEEGIPLSNLGQSRMSVQSELQWWEDFEAWKVDTRDAISMLDTGRARRWAKLGRYTPIRRFPQALNRQHEKHIQMADVWIVRLQEEVDYWDERLKEETD